MKLLIDIPKEFEQHFQMDRFEDSLNRLSADAHLLAGLYEQETIIMLNEAFKNATLISSHGRLIDADSLHKIMMKHAEKHGGVGGLMVALAAVCIDVAPTIIPAEETSTEDINIPTTDDLLYEEEGRIQHNEKH